MRTKSVFFEPYSDELRNSLQKVGLKFKIVGDGHIVPKMLSYSIYQDHEASESMLAKAHNQVIKTVEYSSSDLQNARWLTMRPALNKVVVINRDKAFRFGCSYHDVNGISRTNHGEQIGIIQISSDAQWGAKHYFFAPDYGASEIFTNKKIVDLIAANQLKGVTAQPVLDKAGMPCHDTFQLLSNLIISRDAVALGYGETIINCPICGKSQYTCDNQYQLHIYQEELELGVDMYMTDSMFGYGIAEPFYIISNRFYTLLSNNKQTADVLFAPVIEVGHIIQGNGSEFRGTVL